MTRSTSASKLIRRCLILALAVVPAAAVIAQPKSPVVKPAGKSPLDSLDERKLMAEMANRGMNDLLDFYFKKNNIPDAERKETVVIIALKNLDSPEFARKTMAERKAEIQKIVDGINAILPSINDPQQLLKYAASLITNGTMRLVNTLEYWGDNPKTQAALNPIAETVDKILDQAIKLEEPEAEKWLNQVKADGDPAYKKWEAAEQIKRLAIYNRAQAAYGLALSYDKAAAEKRAKVCKDAIDALKDFESIPSVTSQVRLAIAKLSMVMGGDEGYKQAKEYFKKIIDAKGDPGVEYQARYFNLVCDLLAHKPDEAQKGLSGLKEWQDANLPKDAATQKGIEAAYSMLEYRIAASKAEAAADPTTKEKLNADAVAVLMDLVARRPELRSIIFEQVMDKIPAKPNLPELNPLLLEALVTRGIDAMRHTTPEKDDSKNIQMAADAAREVVKRKGKPGISAEQVDMAAYVIGIFEERIGSAKDLTPDEQRTNRADAAEAFLNYVKNHGGNKIRAEDCLDHALPLLANLRKDGANDDRVNKLWDEALDLALFKAGRTQLAFAYAQRRMELQDYPNARKGLLMVKDEPKLEVPRRYYLMVCDNQLLNKASEPAEKKMLSDEIQKLADELNPLIDKQIAAASDAGKKLFYERTKVQIVLLAADVARANKDLNRVVALLSGFESRLTVLPPKEQNEFLGAAMFLRVNALIGLKKNQEAIDQIQKMVQKQKPEEALATIATLLERLNESFNQEKGKQNPDTATLLLLAQQRAQLAGLLMEQVQRNPAMPEDNKRQYVQFNATAQRQAANLETDPAKKKQYVDAAIKTYEEQLKGVPADSSEAASLERLIALAHYELGDAANLQACHDTLMRLFNEKKFGTEMVRIGDESKFNEIYWEALVRLLQCKVQLAKLKNDPSYLDDPTEGARHIMKNKIILFGDQAGGDAYGKEFRALRRELLPDWNPNAATQPVAGGQ